MDRMPREVFRHVMILLCINIHELEGERLNERGEQGVDGGIGRKTGGGELLGMTTEVCEDLEKDFRREGEERG